MLQMHEGKREKLLVLRVDDHLNPSHISGRTDFLVLEKHHAYLHVIDFWLN